MYYLIKKSCWLLLIFTVLLGVPASAKSNRVRYYKVRAGDTLGGIARKFGTSTRRLASINRIRRSSKIYAGKRIRVGYKKVSRSKRKYRKSRRRRRSRKWKARAPEVKKGHHWLNLSGQTRVLLPFNYKKPKTKQKVFYSNNYYIKLFAEDFKQGNLVYMELLPRGKRRSFTNGETYKVTYAGKPVPLTRTAWGYKSILAFNPYKKHGRYPLKVAETTNSSTSKNTFSIYVKKTRFPAYTRKVYLGNYDKKKKWDPVKKKRWEEKWRKVRELIKVGSRKKKQVFALRTPNKIKARLAHPRDMHKVTSSFFTLRRIKRWFRKGGKRHYKPVRNKRHSGLDLKGRWGEPIYSMADGKVVISQRMYFEGNFVVIDHGNGIFSGYMHQTEAVVREGQWVRAGQLIGKSGNTGLSFGPHLHMSIWVRGVPTMPTSLLALPIRE